MADEGFKRKLTAILSADAVEYSRLMVDDEERTVLTLKTYREAISTLIKDHKGRVVDSPGDNILAEFASIVDALRCAWDVQQEIKLRNVDLSENRRMYFRIGINLGDVIEEGGRIYGDGVNIAARLESLSERGGICISGTAYDQVKNKLPFRIEYKGDQPVKNIKDPVRVYRIVMNSDALSEEINKSDRILSHWRKPIIVIGVIVILIGCVAGYAWNTYYSLPAVKRLPEEMRVFDLPKGPSIAVLPFLNIGGDPEQDYFCDGLTENIITGLSASRKLFVIASDSTFIYKGQAAKSSTVAHELGVNYVLNGSIQKFKNNVRINAQLVDAATGKNLWANKYDRELKDIFVLQDEITLEILIALNVNILEGNQANIWVRGCTKNLEAYMKGLKGLHHLRSQNRAENLLARQLAKEALLMAPECSNLYVLLAHTYLMDIYYEAGSPALSFALATKNLNKAFAMERESATAYVSLATLFLFKGEYEAAIAAGERAVALNPSGADTYNQLGLILCSSGQCEKAIDFHRKAIALNPFAPGIYFSMLGWAYYESNQYDEGIKSLEESLKRDPSNIVAHISLTIAYYKSGMENRARLQAKEVYKIDPSFKTDIINSWPVKNKESLKNSIEILRKVGLK